MAKKEKKKAGKLWGGRFEAATDASVEQFTESVSFDRRLAPFDIQGSMAHARMLGRQGIIPEADAGKIIRGLKAALKDIEAGKFDFDPALEDVHMNIEAALTHAIGPVGGKLHTGRSRNDQVATATRLWQRAQIDATAKAFEKLIGTIVTIAEKEKETILPGYTHLQRAQPITLAHHLLAYAQMFARDLERLAEVRARTNVLPLGSGALAGSSLPLDRKGVAEELGFDSLSQNSLDAVSDRDYQYEFLSAATLSGIHLSRLCEELVLWSSAEFGFIQMSDAFTTGSSLMPQKRNPDVAEIIRGKSGRLTGNLMSLLTVVKGLPLSYNRDMQEDKEPLFDSADTWLACVQLTEKMLRATKFNRKRMAEAAADPMLLATELADYLVRKGLPFRQAHEVVGKLVAACEKQKKTLVDFTPAELKNFSELFGVDALNVLDAGAAVNARTLVGGPAPKAVTRQIKELQKLLAKPRPWRQKSFRSTKKKR